MRLRKHNGTLRVDGEIHIHGSRGRDKRAGPRCLESLDFRHLLWLGPSGSFMDFGFSVGFFLNSSVE